MNVLPGSSGDNNLSSFDSLSEPLSEGQAGTMSSKASGLRSGRLSYLKKG